MADRKWHGRGEEALSVGCRNWGQSPTVSCSPLPLFLSPSLVCKCISISYDLWVFFFSLAVISLFLFPSHTSLPLSFLVSLFLLLSPSPRPVLLHLNPSSSLSFQLSVFWGFFCSVFFLKVQFHSHKERKK